MWRRSGHGGAIDPPAKKTIVVPCFNEAERLDGNGFAAFAVNGAPSLLFVDDGSRDDTRRVLDRIVAALRARGLDADLFALDANGGKGEAVRLGMLRALAAGAEVVGYYDADLATPPDEMLRLLQVLEERELDVVLGARVALLGRDIARKAHRHYLGRVFATFASLLLGIPVYDTQCGAKVFRGTPALEAALGEPFAARWAFDVELLGRLLAGARGAPALAVSKIAEVPLRTWHDVAGSTLRPSAFPILGLELLRIRTALARWQAR
jgi:glycosyltransferase involved in cell wall biosynthesis